MRKLFINLFALSLVVLGYSQDSSKDAKEVTLEGVTVSPLNLSYLSSVTEESMPASIRELEYKAAGFDITDSEIYDADIDVYEVMFSQNDGSIMATYDKSGRILTSFERFNDITLPFSVRNKIYNENPGWIIHKDAYVVSYYRDTGVRKFCKVQLRKNGKRKNIKIDMAGNSI